MQSLSCTALPTAGHAWTDEHDAHRDCVGPKVLMSQPSVCLELHSRSELAADKEVHQTPRSHQGR